MNLIIKKMILVIVGTMIAAYGIVLAIHAGFGGATLAVLWEGISKTFHITMGQASFLIAIEMIIFCLFYDRKQISWGTLMYQVIYSFFVDVFANCVVYSQSAIINFVLMVLGICLLSLGSGIYSYADFGRGSYEAMTFAFVHRNHWQTKYVRIALDVVCVIINVLLGGVMGACTIVTVLLSGVLLQKVVEFLKKYNVMKLEKNKNIKNGDYK